MTAECDECQEYSPFFSCRNAKSVLFFVKFEMIFWFVTNNLLVRLCIEFSYMLSVHFKCEMYAYKKYVDMCVNIKCVALLFLWSFREPVTVRQHLIVILCT